MEFVKNIIQVVQIVFFGIWRCLWVYFLGHFVCHCDSVCDMVVGGVEWPGGSGVLLNRLFVCFDSYRATHPAAIVMSNGWIVGGKVSE